MDIIDYTVEYYSRIRQYTCLGSIPRQVNYIARQVNYNRYLILIFVVQAKYDLSVEVYVHLGMCSFFSKAIFRNDLGLIAEYSWK
jgi:hypothetical protein